MKTLSILRAADSMDLQLSLSDYERRISSVGLFQAVSIGEELYRKRIPVDKIYCSSARRAKQTAVIVKEVGEIDAPIFYKDCLYGMPPLKYKNSCLELLVSCDSVLLIGHNPDLEFLARTLTGLPIAFDNAMLMKIDFDVKRWEDIVLSTDAALIDLIICPKDCSMQKAA